MKQVTGKVECTVKDGLTGNEKTESAPVTYPEFETADDVLAYLAGSEMKLADGTVLVTAPADVVTDGKVAKTAADVLKERVTEFIKAANYGLNLNARSEVRSQLQAKLEGPDKAINKLVADIVKARAAAGMPISETDARKLAVSMLGLQPAVETAPATPEQAATV